MVGFVIGPTVSISDTVGAFVVDPASLSDADLIKAYQESGGEAGDPRADELADEISRRNLDL